MIAEGSLQDFSFSDLLQIISLNTSSGTLRLSSEGREGFLDCHQGEIRSAKAQERTGEDAVYALFHWETGTFRFDEGMPSAPGNIDKPLAELAKEGIRRLDQWRAIRAELPALSMRARFKSDQAQLPSAVHHQAAEVWAVLAGTDGVTLSEVASATRLDELTVAQHLLELFQAGTVTVETAPEEALRSMFRRASEEVYSRFASISGLKMTEGLETLLNSLARTKGVELRWRSGHVQDGLPSALAAAALRPIYRDFLIHELEYVTKIHGPGFAEKALDGALAAFSPEEKSSFLALDLPEALTARTT
jgi:hypothetical protein